MLRVPRARQRGDRGASAVEFALIFSVILVPLLIGMLQYGFWFNDALSVREAAREGARQGVVGNFTACGGEATDLGKLKCTIKNQVTPLTGTAYVRVVRPTTWAKGQPLKVCATVSSDGGFGLLPLPNGGWLRTETEFSIEVEKLPTTNAAPTGTTTNGSDTAPAGQNWDWC